MTFNFSDLSAPLSDNHKTAAARDTSHLWQTVSDTTWKGIQPGESQLNKPVTLDSIPLPSAHSRAETIAEGVARAGNKGLIMMPNDGDMMHGGPATDQIYHKISDATRSITNKELDVAKQKFAALSPQEQALVQQEASMSHVYADNKVPTPHYDAFVQSVQTATKPLEEQRAEIGRQVLAGLPKDLVRAKQEEDFFHSHIKAL